MLHNREVSFWRKGGSAIRNALVVCLFLIVVDFQHYISSRMWELDGEESWVPESWCFLAVVLEKTLESPLDCKEI